jgi:hypothetical protein
LRGACSERRKKDLTLTTIVANDQAPPLTSIGGGFRVIGANGLANVYGHADARDAQVANALTLDEARRIARNIANAKAAQ